jgi:hypothetical protein
MYLGMYLKIPRYSGILRMSPGNYLNTTGIHVSVPHTAEGHLDGWTIDDDDEAS